MNKAVFTASQSKINYAMRANNFELYVLAEVILQSNPSILWIWGMHSVDARKKIRMRLKERLVGDLDYGNNRRNNREEAAKAAAEKEQLLLEEVKGMARSESVGSVSASESLGEKSYAPASPSSTAKGSQLKSLGQTKKIMAHHTVPVPENAKKKIIQ